MAITAAGMRAVRSAAALVGVLPRARVHIRDGERTVVTVSRTPVREGGGGFVLPPCAFRSAVADAYRLYQHGARFQFLDLPVDREPAIDVGLPAGDMVLPGGIYRVRVCGDRQLFLFLTGLGVAAADHAVTTAIAGSEPDGDVFDQLDPQGMIDGRIGFHGDPAAELTVVHALAATADAEGAARVVTRLLEICAAAEMVADIEAIPPASRERFERGGR
jgi:hypothetical protein